jgi:hypothetical protein
MFQFGFRTKKGEEIALVCLRHYFLWITMLPPPSCIWLVEVPICRFMICELPLGFENEMAIVSVPVLCGRP